MCVYYGPIGGQTVGGTLFLRVAVCRCSRARLLLVAFFSASRHEKYGCVVAGAVGRAGCHRMWNHYYCYFV